MKSSNPFSRPSQRAVAMAAAFLLAGPALAACGGGEPDVSLKVMTWGGVFTETEQKAYYEPYTKETSVKVTPITPVSLAKIKASVTNQTGDIDVSSMSVAEYFQAIEEDLLEPIDYQAVKQDPDVPADVYEKFGVKANSISYQLVYNSETYPDDGPETWADFWDVANFPGDRALWDSPVGNIEFALLADGVPIDELYPLDDAKLDRAFQKLDEIKPSVKVWWQQGAQSQQLFQDGQVEMMMMWNGRATDLINQGSPLVQVWNQAALAVNRWIVPKGAANAAKAMEFINSAMAPDRQATFASLAYGPSVPQAFDHLAAETADIQPSSPEHQEIAFEVDGQWWGQNLPKVLPRWQSWLSTN